MGRKHDYFIFCFIFLCFIIAISIAGIKCPIGDKESLTDAGIDAIPIMADDDYSTWATSTIGISDIYLYSTSITFGGGGGEKETVLSEGDLKSLSLQEIRDLGVLIALCQVNFSPKVIYLWGKKLLPRFFKDKEE